MSGGDLAWGIAVIAAGIFISVYGTMLFRFALAAIGFGAGFVLAIWIFEGQDETVRVLLAFAAGGAGALILSAPVSITLYLAGAILGVVLGVLVCGVIEVFWSRPDGILAAIFAIAGGGLGAFFGPRLGSMIVLLASAGAGAFLIVDGLRVLFESRFQTEVTDPTKNLAQRLTLAIFFVFFAVSALAQFNYRRFQRRVVAAPRAVR